jgi:hypothetical protein
MAKDYATETDIIETADPLFFPGDMVKARTQFLRTYIRDFSWDSLNKTWTYCLVHFTQPGYDPKWSGSIADDSVPEKDLKLISRVHKIKVS